MKSVSWNLITWSEGVSLQVRIRPTQIQYFFPLLLTRVDLSLLFSGPHIHVKRGFSLSRIVNKSPWIWIWISILWDVICNGISMTSLRKLNLVGYDLCCKRSAIRAEYSILIVQGIPHISWDINNELLHYACQILRRQTIYFMSRIYQIS